MLRNNIFYCICCLYTFCSYNFFVHSSFSSNVYHNISYYIMPQNNNNSFFFYLSCRYFSLLNMFSLSFSLSLFSPKPPLRVFDKKVSGHIWTSLDYFYFFLLFLPSSEYYTSCCQTNINKLCACLYLGLINSLSCLDFSHLPPTLSQYSCLSI